jgi:hypothetical protein
MQKIKYFISAIIFFLIVFFLFCPADLPENSQFKDLMSSDFQEDVLIVFNAGGWGDTPPEEAEDLSPIIDGIIGTLSDRGYKSIVIPYERTKKGVLAKIRGFREMMGYFRVQSGEVSKNIGSFLTKNQEKKVILVGLSNGAGFVEETMKKISDNQHSVLAVEVGIPFWHKEIESDNILRINNEDQDSLTAGKVSNLLPTLFKAPAKWMLAKISGANLSFSRAFAFADHRYYWDSLWVREPIISFVKEGMIRR